MWKRLEDSISINEKLARLSWPALGTWVYILPNTDAKGRYHADSRIIKARCMTMRYDARLELVDEALAELVTEKLIHRYDVDGKPYLVMHDYDQHQPTGALRYVDAKFPEPPVGSIKCKCLEAKEPKDGAKHGANAPSSLSLSPSPSLSQSIPITSEGEFEGERISPTIRHLYQRAREAKVAGRKDTILSYLDAWAARSNAGKVEQVLMDPWTKGKTVIEIQEHFFNGTSNGPDYRKQAEDQFLRSGK